MVFLSVILITSWSEEIIERRKCLKMWSSLPVSWTDIAMLLSWIRYELNTRAFNSVFRMGWGRLVPTIYWDIGMGTRILWCIWLQTPSARLTLVFLMIFDIFFIWEGYKKKGNLGFWLNLHWPPHPNLGLFFEPTIFFVPKIIFNQKIFFIQKHFLDYTFLDPKIFLD